jgi:glycosyltransferase involved in cell wall biosynthesis
MRILLLNDYARPIGGGEVMLYTIRDELRRRGHDARLFASDAPVSALAGRADYSCFGTTSRARGLVQAANPWAAAALRRVMREFRPDVAHVTMFMTQLSPLIMPLLRGVPTLFHAVWYRYVCPTGTKMLPTLAPCRHQAGVACLRAGCVAMHDWVPLMVQHALVRRWSGRFGAIAAVSDAVRDRLTESGIVVDDVIPAPIPVRPARPPLCGPPAALFAGRLVPEKGAEVLLRAFARVHRELPDACLTIVGDGPSRPELTALRSELALDHVVQMRPQLPRESLERVADSAWVQVVPSVWEEPFGLSAAEAMMRGTAVIASRIGGLPNVVGDVDANSLVPPRDDRALADALLAFLGRRDRCEAAGAAGRTSALERFAPDHVTDRFLAQYARLGATMSSVGS